MSSAGRGGGARAYRLACGEPLTSLLAPHREPPTAEIARASESAPGLVLGPLTALVERPKPAASPEPVPGSGARDCWPDLPVDRRH